MIRLHALFVSGAIALCTFCSADNIGGGISAGFRFGAPRWGTFDQFRSSYSEFYKDDIKKDLSGFGLGTGIGINGDMNINGFVMGLRYSQYTTRDQVSFHSGGIRHFDARQTLWTFAMGFGYQREKAHAQFTLGVLAGNDRLDSYYEYTDGTKSYAGERGLNGKFNAMRFGWSARAEFSLLYFYTGIEYVFGGSGNLSMTLDDSFTETDGLPTEYGAWVANPTSYDFDKYVQPGLNGFRFEIGLRLNIADE